MFVASVSISISVICDLDQNRISQCTAYRVRAFNIMLKINLGTYIEFSFDIIVHIHSKVTKILKKFNSYVTE